MLSLKTKHVIRMARIFQNVWNKNPALFRTDRDSSAPVTGVPRGRKGRFPPKFLEYLVILCFKRRYCI